MNLPAGVTVYACVAFTRDADASARLSAFSLADGIPREGAAGGLLFSRGHRDILTTEQLDTPFMHMEARCVSSSRCRCCCVLLSVSA